MRATHPGASGLIDNFSPSASYCVSHRVAQNEYYRMKKTIRPVVAANLAAPMQRQHKLTLHPRQQAVAPTPALDFVSSRVPNGRVLPNYGFDGGGKTLVNAGAVMGDVLSPQKARILLMLLLQNGANNQKDVQEPFSR